MKSKGFTLIELLVVIAIIGILASVVLASLNTARSKGADSAIKANLTNIRVQAQSYYDDNADYGADFALGTCADAVLAANTIFADDTKISTIIENAGIVSDGGGLASAVCTSSATAWAVSVPLKTDPAKSWCVDSEGASKQVTGPIVTDSVCPAN
ncbi:MAG: type II secretion system protein [Minisyncoccia bacterium]